MTDDFITIPEAARRLELSERQARRYAAKLPEEDRLPGPPITIRLSALVERMPDKGRTVPDTLQSRKEETPDSSTDNAGHSPSGGNDALIEQLQSEVMFLRSALEREQENVKALTGELTEARRESAVMFAAIASGRMVLPMPDTSANVPDNAGHSDGHRPDIGRTNNSEMPDSAGQVDPYGNTAPVTTGGTQESDRAAGRVETPPDTSEGKKRAWWQWWKR